MSENELLSKEIIKDIYNRNYGHGGADDIEFGKLVAEYQHKKSLALFREEGYVKQLVDQSLPCKDDLTGCDLSLAQIRIVKQMWRTGWRKVELEGRSTLSEQPLQIIGVPKDPVFAWNLIDMKTNMLLACEHPVPDSALCDVCRTELLSNAREIIHNVVEKNGKWVQEQSES